MTGEAPPFLFVDQEHISLDLGRQRDRLCLAFVEVISQGGGEALIANGTASEPPRLESLLDRGFRF